MKWFTEIAWASWHEVYPLHTRAGCLSPSCTLWGYLNRFFLVLCAFHYTGQIFFFVLGYATLILQALLYARHCYVGLLGMSNKQYGSQYRDNQLLFLLLDLLSYPFPSSPSKVWVYRGRGNLLGLWEDNTQYNESLSQNGTSRFWWGHLSGGSFEKTRKRLRKHVRDGSLKMY